MCDLDEFRQHLVDVPYLIQLPYLTWTCEESLEERPQEIIVCTAGPMGPIFEDTNQATIHTLLDHRVVTIPIQLLVAVSRYLVVDHYLGDTINRPEVLVIRADYVDRGNVELPTQFTGFLRGCKVAVLHAE